MTARSLAEQALELAGKATPGPWEAVTEDEDVVVVEGEADLATVPENDPGTVLASLGPDCRHGWKAAADAEFIAFARTALPALAERVLALEEALRHVINDSPGTPASVKQYLCAALAADPGEREGQ